MRAQWERVREALVQSIVTLEADLLFRELHSGESFLSAFASPSELVHFLASAGGDFDRKDAIYANLVRLVQLRNRHSELALSVAMLGLWPGLDTIYRRNLRFFPSATDDLVSELSNLFPSSVAKADLNQICRVAATLVKNVSRDLRRRLRRSWEEARRRADLPDDDVLDTDEVVEGPWAVDANEDASVRAIRTWLDAVVETDRDLLERVLVHGETQKEAGEALGLSHDAARKRYQRAIGRLSHSGHGNGVSPVKGAKRP